MDNEKKIRNEVKMNKKILKNKKLTKLFLWVMLVQMATTLNYHPMLAKAYSGTINFSGSDMSETGSIVIDGQSGSVSASDVADITIRIFGSTDKVSSTGKFIYLDFQNVITPSDVPTYQYNYIVIESSDGSDFSLQSIYINNCNMTEDAVKVEGIRNGSSIGTVNLALDAGGNPTQFTTSSGLTASIFQNVDKIVISSNTISATDVTAGIGAIQISDPVLPTVSLIADTTSNSVDNDLEITFTPDVNFETAITGVSYNGNTLTSNQYTISSGKLTLHPSALDNTYLKTPGTANVVITATGYGNSSVAQTIRAGAVDSLEITTQPIPGVASGDLLATQPIVKLKDQYGNYCTTGVSATANVVATAKSGTGSFSIGGTTTKAAVAGTATFTDLSCTLTTAGNGRITFTSGSKTVDSSIFTIPQKAAKVLTADTTSNSVDNDLEITFTPDVNFETAITGVSYNGNTLTSNQYTISSGKLTLHPSALDNTYLKTPGTANVVITATGYGNSSVAQTIRAGAVDSLEITTQPIPGVASGDLLATQPIVKLKDQYGNYCTTGVSATANVVATAKSGTGSFSIGGTTTKAAVAGTATFTDLSCTLTTAGNGRITFTSGSKTVDSSIFTIPQKAAKVLTADTTSNSVDNDLEITFTPDASFQTAITGVSYNGNTLTSNQYTISSGKLTLHPSSSDNLYLRTSGSGNIVISASGYVNSEVMQIITHGVLNRMSVEQNISAPATNGGQFVNQPIIVLVDQYGNICTSDNSTQVTVSKKDSSNWTLTGTLSLTANAGRVVFTSLGATNTGTINNAQLAFDANLLLQILSTTVTLPRVPQAPDNYIVNSSGSTPVKSVTSMVIINETEQTVGSEIQTPEDGRTVINVSVNHSSEEIKTSVLTSQEQEMVARGENVKVILKVSDISNRVSNEEKMLIRQKVSENSITIASILYVDLSLFKQIGNQEQTRVTEASNKINISIKVPEKLWNTDTTRNRAFYIVRIHDGVVTRIDGTYDMVTHLFTFETDKFSTYALTYQDTSSIKNYQDFFHLQLKVKSNKNTQILSYKKITGADGYQIYGGRCGGKMTKLADVPAKTHSYIVKNLNQRSYYKYQVKAYQIIDGKQVVIVTSKVVHSITESKTHGNPIEVTSDTVSATLKVGKTKNIICQVVLPKNKKMKEHTATIRFESSNKAIVTISSKGVITAKAKGTCYVYAYAQNGVYKKIKVTVK